METKPSQWNIEEALKIAVKVEEVLVSCKLKAHVALGGSVLLTGFSINDLDLFVYNHGVDLDKKELLSKKAIIENLNRILKWNLQDARFVGNGIYAGERFGPFVYSTKDALGREIDIFFVEKDYTDI